MLKKLLVVTVVAMLQAMSFSVSAVTFDFVAEASGNEHGAASITVNDVSGLGVTATGFDSSTGAAYSAYLDDVSGGPGGLGVCQNLIVDQCNPSSDDNVTFGESLKLVFNQEVTIDQITFNNGDHKQTFSGDFDLTINGGSTMTYALTNIFNVPLTGTEFIFANPNSLGGSGVSNEYQFYIGALEVTPVPVPPAVWLFGSGLLGLVAVARRRV